MRTRIDQIRNFIISKSLQWKALYSLDSFSHWSEWKKSIEGNDIADKLANAVRTKIPQKHALKIFEECGKIAANLCMEIFRLSEISAHGPLHFKKCDDIVGLKALFILWSDYGGGSDPPQVFAPRAIISRR